MIEPSPSPTSPTDPQESPSLRQDPADGSPSATRHDFQLGRRFFHLANGVLTATGYALFFTHEQVIHTFGTIACVVYIADRMRMAYPEAIAKHAPWINRSLVRAEEQVRESAMIPYVIAVLLTIITVPKRAALVAIYSLAIADPLAALVGIRFGRHRLTANRSLEGSAAFFFVVGTTAGLVLGWDATVAPWTLAAASAAIGFSAAVCEIIPIRIDDNLTIPLFVAFLTWGIAASFGIGLG